jgi:hypothetical protein
MGNVMDVPKVVVEAIEAVTTEAGATGLGTPEYNIRCAPD